MNSNLKIAIEASIKAGKAIMEFYNTNFETEIKNDNSPITEADKCANEIIHSFLIKTDIPIISEENKQIDYSERKNWNTCWIVDPLDGTKEFIKRNGEFTVNIALVINKEPILGVIYKPEKKWLYYADVNENIGYKAILENDDCDINSVLNLSKQIHPLKNDSSIRVVGSRSHMNEETKNYIEDLKEKNSDKKIEIVSIGSSLKFCFIAEGKADVYPRFAATMEWDTAAGQAICKAVGLKVVSVSTNKEMQYNKENLLNSYFLVNNQ
jgi:3'(2'), 5'-bisphosphate nucleotidase